MRKAELKETKILNAIFSAYAVEKSTKLKTVTPQPYFFKIVHNIKRTFYVG